MPETKPIPAELLYHIMTSVPGDLEEATILIEQLRDELCNRPAEVTVQLGRGLTAYIPKQEDFYPQVIRDCSVLVAYDDGRERWSIEFEAYATNHGVQPCPRGV